MNVVQRTTPTHRAQTVPKVHAVSSEAQPIVTKATQLVDATTRNVNTNGPPATHGVSLQSDAMEDCIPEPARSRQVGTTDSHAILPQAMDGVETSPGSTHGTNIGQDKMDDIQITIQPTFTPPATKFVQNENQNMPDAPPPANVTLDSTTQSNVAPSSTLLVEIKDQDMTDAPPPAQFTIASGCSASEASTITSSTTRSERSTSRFPLAPTMFLSSVRQPSAKAQANPSNHWANGKANALLIEIPDLHNDLRQALPKMIEERHRNQVCDKIFDFIRNAGSAAELARDIDLAMRMPSQDKLLNNAQFNRLEKYAHEVQNARRRQERQIGGVLNMGSPLHTNNQIGISQPPTNGTAQPANLITPPNLSQAAPTIIAQPTNLPTLPQMTNAGAAGFSTNLTRRESITPEPKSSKERLTKLLIDAQVKTTRNKDEVSTLFAIMFHLSWQKSSDIDVMIEYVIKHPRFQGLDSNERRRVNIEWTIEVIQNLVDDGRPSSCELLVWTCKEALIAQHVKAENETLSAYATCADRQKELGPLFRRISATNFELMKEVYPNGCLTWDEMRDLAKTEELGFFDQSVNTKQMPYWPYMRDKKQYWSDRANMKKLVADRIAAKSMTTGRATASGPAVSSKAKRNIAAISDDHDKASKEIGVDAMDDGETHVPGSKEPALKRFREQPTE
ncbi:uncharacterized protein ALTATR162_LOCUS11843 [Alternaria atra]|uniref:Uncharacterized protein n=1 Tax=Alternaria atra TaxID=119953 RepID=A0A8J2N5X2_9PLEO|nr:uncharacterized protein ALTATR162_LOCUS11843 [Alternaria atra]CAG5187998.1 unnamed protein product [Alternaria atra]